MERIRLDKISEIICCRSASEIDAIAEEVNSQGDECTGLFCKYEIKYDVSGCCIEKVDAVTVILEDLNFDEDPEAHGRPYVTIGRVLVFYVPRNLTEYVVDTFYGKSRTPSVPLDDMRVKERAIMDFFVESIEDGNREVVCVLTDYGGFGDRAALAYIPDKDHPLELMRKRFSDKLTIKWKMTQRRYRALQQIDLNPYETAHMVAKVYEIRAYDSVDEHGKKHVELYGLFDPIKVKEPGLCFY